MDDFEQRVRERAYLLWIEEGLPMGREVEHWRQAYELVGKESSEQGLRDETRPPRESDPPDEAATYVGAGTAPLAPSADAGEDQGKPRPAKGRAREKAVTGINRAAAKRSPSKKSR